MHGYMLSKVIKTFDYVLTSTPNHYKGYLQSVCCNIVIKARLLSVSTSNVICQSFYEHPIEEILDDSIECQARTNKINVLEHESSENEYIRLLNRGSLFDCKLLQAKILKVGFDSDIEICSRVFDVYVAGGELYSALQGFDVLPCKNVCFWNNLLYSIVAKKAFTQVFALFSRIVNECVEVDEDTFVYVLRACSGSRVDIRRVEQIHAKVVYYGFAKNQFVCNPMIDFYSRRGLIDYAKHIFTGLCFRDSVSWVAMISGFSRNGREEDGILLYKEMCSSGFTPTPYIFSSVLSASTKIEQYELGQQLHASIYKWQFSSEIFICNALVTLYLRCGKLTYADQIFGKMHSKDEVTYNALIAGFSQQGFSKRSVQLFQQMQLDSLKPGCVTIASLLSACASLGALDSGRQLHSHATKAGMCSDIIIEGSLLDLYVKCSDLETARNFFLTTRTENIVLWNVMLGAYGQKGDLYRSYQTFAQMQNECLEPNQYTYPSILRTCTSVGAFDLGEQIHTHVVKSGFQPNVYVCSVLIDMYSKNGKLDDALKILRRIREKDVVSWTAMVAGYAQHNLFTEALKLIIEMQDQRIQLDNIGLSSAISACAGIQALNQGRQMHAQSIVSGYSWDVSIGNSLVCLYARCGKVNDAYLTFQKIDMKDKISWNGLISGFSQSGYCQEALKVFFQMNKVAMEADIFTYISAVSAAANTTNVKQGKQIHSKIIKCGCNAEPEASNVLITLYAKCGSLSDAMREFHEMPQKNEVSWNAMITGYSQHGYGHEAIDLFEKMTCQGMTPNYVTFVSVLSACSHVGLVEEGLGYFKSMSEKRGLLPKPEHYACVVDILGRAGQICRAVKFVETMPIEPDAMVWRTLLSACTIHKNMEVGELAAHHLLQLEPQDSATYVLVSNMYAVSRKWEYRDQTRKLMKERGINKEPGRSWIEVKNDIHAFFVGDRLHPLATQIYTFLEDLNEKIATLGYVPDRNSLWNDMELGQKDPTTYVHSEKLAIAFGLLSLSEAIPLHVMKNLRVCNDCHNWIKFVSRISNRVIIVRDSYRFHHFEDGSCSCRDYW
ncbi:hypothetical protein LIER_05459 [Lithospermum erythrorhizon]|uniref:DYW domain-containing protein n=1 Tax=Lithospermum erythrorhizon TaxID=34254 RepID=A0AAV3P0X4_LITER